MNNQPLEVLAIKEYEQNIDGNTIKRTQWNRVGRAWLTKSQESIGFELFLFPGQRYLIQYPKRKQDPTPEYKPENSMEA